jgi:DNA-binding NtrC family response regulator
MNAIKHQIPAKAIVFVVDDEPMLLHLAVAVLESVGCEVRTFRDPRRALEAFSAVRPAVVVTDYSMGGMNGMDLIRECRQLNPGQKAVLISGTVDGDVFADSPVKPDRFLAKPYQIDELTHCVRTLLPA